MIDYRQKIKEASDDIERAYWVGRMREFEDWKLCSEEMPTENKKYLVLTILGFHKLMTYIPEAEMFADAQGLVTKGEAWKEVV